MLPLLTVLKLPTVAPSPLMIGPELSPPTDTAPSPAAVVLSPRVKSPVSNPKLNASSMLIV